MVVIFPIGSEQALVTLIYTTEDLQFLAIPRKHKQYWYSQICSQIYSTCISKMLLFEFGRTTLNFRLFKVEADVHFNVHYSHQEVIANEIEKDKNLPF